ncbi:MAG: hypothetical protein HKN75_07035 [Bacteroidia bacterium]|nr:hypothetical protein [Bacteroidia bacterium]
MRYLLSLLIIFICFSVTSLHGQSLIDEKIQKIELEQNKSSLFQFYLDEPAKKILKLEYESDGKEIDGELSEDGKTVYLKDYKAKSRVKASVVYRTGKKDSFTKSSCYIDPVIPIL